VFCGNYLSGIIARTDFSVMTVKRRWLKKSMTVSRRRSSRSATGYPLPATAPDSAARRYYRSPIYDTGYEKIPIPSSGWQDVFVSLRKTESPYMPPYVPYMNNTTAMATHSARPPVHSPLTVPELEHLRKEAASSLISGRRGFCRGTFRHLLSRGGISSFAAGFNYTDPIVIVR